MGVAQGHFDAGPRLCCCAGEWDGASSQEDAFLLGEPADWVFVCVFRMSVFRVCPCRV